MLNRLQIMQQSKPLSDSLNVEDPVWKAWRIMKDRDLKHLPVKKAEKIVGIVSDRDIVQISGFNGGQSMPVKDAMSLDPLVVNKNDSVASTLKAMLAKDQQQAIVVDDAGEICGLFSWDCAFQFFLELGELPPIKEVSN